MLAGVADRPRRRPVGVLAVAGALAATLLVGAFGTGVVTLAAPGAAPAECRDVTLFAVNGSGAAGGETLAAVTDPLVQQVGERLAVVAVAGPEVGASYEASEQQAVATLTDQVAAQLAACPGSRVMLFGYSQGAHVAGDVAARIGAGQDPRVPADRVLAVGLFGDPARSAGVRTVPAGVTGQGVLPAREGGFGALAAPHHRGLRAAGPGVRHRGRRHPAAAGAGRRRPGAHRLPAARRRSGHPGDGLGVRVAGPAHHLAARARHGSRGRAADGHRHGCAVRGDHGAGDDGAPAAPVAGRRPGSRGRRARRIAGRPPPAPVGRVPARPSRRGRRLPGRARGPRRRGRPLPGRAATRATAPVPARPSPRAPRLPGRAPAPERPARSTPAPTPATTREGTPAPARARRRPPPRPARARARAGRRPRRRRAPAARAAPDRLGPRADGLARSDRHHGTADRRDGVGRHGHGIGGPQRGARSTTRRTSRRPLDATAARARGTGSSGTRTGSAEPTTTRTTPSDAVAPTGRARTTADDDAADEAPGRPAGRGAAARARPPTPCGR